MSGGSNTQQSGLRDNDVNIDGTALHVPMRLTYNHTLRQTLSDQSNGKKRITRPYDGAGLPAQPDIFDFMLEYQFSENVGSTYSADQTFLEGLRTAGAAHTFAFWKTFKYTFNAPSGGAVFYLPRPDAFSKSYANHTATGYKAVVTLADLSTPTVAYQASVVAGTAVGAGQVWISNTAISHPESGALVALFKFGTAFASAQSFTVEYFPLFHVDVTQLPTSPFDGSVDVTSENKILYLVEV